MKINRLLEITLLLAKQKRTTAGVLAQRFGVSTRTIYRDIDALSASGVPVYCSKGKGGGICLMDGFVVGDARLTETEKGSLSAALSMLKAAKQPDADEILSKLGAVFNGKTQDWIHIDFTPWGSGEAEQLRFSIIKQSILGQTRIGFTYLNSYGQQSKRDAEPHFLWYKGNGWYVYAYCTSKLGFRLFRLTRMSDVKQRAATFKRRAIEAFDANESSLPAQTLRLKFSKSALYRVHDVFDADCVQKQADGSALVAVDMPVDEWIYGFLLSFGNGLTVLAPKAVASEMKKRIGTMQNNYA